MNWNHEHAWEHTVCCDESGNTAIYDKPFFQNVCGHAPGTFLVGVKCWTNLGQVKQYDVYVFENVHGGQSVCIRASDEPGDYSSPGTVLDLLVAARSVHASHFDILPGVNARDSY